MINLRKLAKMEGLSFKNALRLHFDSILLFENKSYPSSFFLSILAQEEIGKVFLLEDFIWHSSAEERMSEEWEDWEKKWISMIYKHSTKQWNFFLGGGAEFSFDKNFIKKAYSGKTETDKQNSVYVGLDRKEGIINMEGKINSPFNIRKEKAIEQITAVNDFLLELILLTIGDYGGLDNEDVNKLINKKLYKKIKSLWKHKNRKAPRYKRIQSLTTEIDKLKRK